MQQKNYKAQVNPFSVVLFDKNGANPIGISPLNDFLYYDLKKDHFVNDVNFNQNRDLIEDIKLTLERLILRPQRLIWKISKNQFTATYEITGDENGTTQIKRTLENLPEGTKAVGQSLTLCKGCMLSDKDKKLIFLREDNLTTENLDQAKKLNLIPLVISEQLPAAVQKILVLKPDGEILLELEISANQEVIFLQDWNILELKTPVQDSNDLKLYQNLKFR